MAIARVNTSASSPGTAGTSWTVAIDVGTVSDGMLITGLYGNPDTITSVTYNGNAMTQITKILTDSDGGAYIYIYAIPIGSTGGSSNLVVSYSSSTQRSHKSASYSGVAQTSYTETTDTTKTASGNNTLDYTISTSGCWAFSVAKGVTVDPTVNTRVTEYNNPPLPQFIQGDSNGTMPTGATTQVWTVTSGGASALGFVFRPVATASTFIPRVSFIM